MERESSIVDSFSGRSRPHRGPRSPARAVRRWSTNDHLALVSL